MTKRTGFLAVLFFVGTVLSLLRPAGPEDSKSQGGLRSAVPVMYRSGLLLEEATDGESPPGSGLDGEDPPASGPDREDQPDSGPIPSSQGRAPAAEDQPYRFLVIPVDGAKLTSPFGPRGQGMHWGIDLAAPEGRPVRAAAAGKVVFAGWNGAYGLLIILAHSGFRTYYAHNSVLLVEKNQQVAAGEIIAAVGRTGRATGSHLHFELEIQGKKVNPLPYLTRTPEMTPAGRNSPEAENGLRNIKNEKESGNGEK